MTFTQATLKSDAQQQLALWNESGPHVLNTPYMPGAGLSWCVVGCVMADAFDPALHETSLVNAIEALAAVTLVGDPRQFGATPEEILINPEPPEDPTHEAVLHVSSALSCQVGPLVPKDIRSRTIKEHEEQPVPAGKNWAVLNLVVSTSLETAGIAALETAIEAIEIGGQQVVTVCEHLIGDTVPVDASDVKLTITSRIRLDRIPVEE